MINIKIPVPHHVRKYLISKYGTEHTLTKTSFLGQLLFMCLDEQFRKPKDVEDTASFSVGIPSKYFNEGRYSAGPDTLKMIGTCFEKLFKEEFHAYVEKEVKNKREAMESVRFFMQAHNITEDDIKLETLYKSYQRYALGDTRKFKKAARKKDTN